MDNADSFEFQRVHRIGRCNTFEGKPRQIIARFSQYPDQESVMSRVKELKGKEFCISADYPKVIIDCRKKKMHLLKRAKEQGKTAFFSRAKPDKLYRWCFSIVICITANQKAI